VCRTIVRHRTGSARSDEDWHRQRRLVMGAIGDEMALEDQEKVDQAAAAAHAKEYNADGTLKADNYRSPALPESKFPPGLKFGGQLRVNREQLTTVATQMQADLSELQATLQTLNNGGPGGSTVGGWTTADAMGTNAGNAWYGISSFYQELNTVYDQVIAYLHQTAGNYGDAEETTATAARNVGSDA
jgi:hypothetical protein